LLRQDTLSWVVGLSKAIETVEITSNADGIILYLTVLASIRGAPVPPVGRWPKALPVAVDVHRRWLESP